MSILLMRLGVWLHVPWPRAVREASPRRDLARPEPPGRAAGSGELRFFSLEAGPPARDPRTELGRFGLLAGRDETRPPRFTDAWPPAL